MPDFCDDTLDIISRVKTISKKDVEIIENEDIMYYAKAKAARSTMDKSVIFYRKTDNINYLVAHECAHLIRIFSCNPALRRIPGTTANTMKRAINELKSRMEYLHFNIDYSHYKLLINQYVMQITSQAQDIWVEKYIYENYSGLHLEQKQYALKIWLDATQLPPKEMQKYLPKYLYNGIYALNIAFFEAFKNITNVGFSEPAWLKQFYPTADKLFNAININATNLSEDNDLINAWADILDCHWIDWFDFEKIPDSYIKDI